jgi:hypothetical protein
VREGWWIKYIELTPGDPTKVQRSDVHRAHGTVYPQFDPGKEDISESESPIDASWEVGWGPSSEDIG